MDAGVDAPDQVERTDDGRYVVVGGRRWRASDPRIPDALRQELVDELMDARRTVGAATRQGDGDAEAEARRRVHAAKVALGERGRAWWEAPTPASTRTRLRAAIAALGRRRAPDRTICPSDAARVVGADGWRSLMDDARAAARSLAAEGAITIRQKGQVVDPTADWRGPVRLRWEGTSPEP